MRRKRLIFGVLLSALLVLFAACGQGKFDGTRVATPTSFSLEIGQMTGTDTHTLELRAGDTLEIHLKAEQGELRLEIRAQDGTLLYSGNGEAVTDFTVHISEGGAYSVRVEARRARGSVSIRLADTEEKTNE